MADEEAQEDDAPKVEPDDNLASKLEKLEGELSMIRGMLDTLQMDGGAMNPGAMMEAGGEDIPTWVAVASEKSHPFKVTIDSGLDVDVESGYLYGKFAGDFKVTAAAASFTMANNTTNKIYLRLEIGADCPSSPFNITGGDDAGDNVAVDINEWWHIINSATIQAGTSIPGSTWSFQDTSSGYKYIEIAEVVTASGKVTSIYQRWHSDIVALPSAGDGWIVDA